MSNFSEQIDEIKTSISSSTGKSIAYSTLVFIQEQSGEDPDLIQTLVEATPSLVSLIVADIHCQDEKIAVQALKCLGFMVYQKSLVAAMSVEALNLVLDSLVTLITTTKIKSVCNLGVWCISVQQFGEQIIASHFNPLLQAVLRSLDNQFGSLSTTFEASQAVMRLAVQSVENMRNSSHVWVPPLYRRLVSLDKRERDMSERCLLKNVSLLIPPPLNLSKALVKDMKQTLLTGMKDLMNSGMKIQAIRAWGWFIKLLGSYALKNRNLVNDMLKIPEHTFSDCDSQLQIATQFAWEGLIDALIHPAILPREINVDEKNERTGTSKSENSEIQGNGFSKSVKLIMRPLVGIMLGKFDASVHGSCFDTWYYLLHKLDSSVNCTSVKELVLQPMFEAIFQIAPDCKSTWLWNRTVDLLGDSILANSGYVKHGASTSEKGSSKEYSIKWLPLEPNHLKFHLNFISIFISRMLKSGLAPEEQSLLSGAVLRLFRSISKGVQMILKIPTTTYDDILLCLSTLLKFVKNIWDEHSDGSEGDNLCDILLQLIEVMIEEIEPATLSSPLYKLALDLGHIKSHTFDNETRHLKIAEICSINHMDMVSPIVHLTVFNFCFTAQSNVNTAQRYRKFMLSSFELANTFIVTVRLLYMCTALSSLRLWTVIAKALVDCIGDVKSISLFKSESAYFATRDMLCYPFIICSRQSSIFQKRSLKFEQVIEVWKSLYGLFCSSRYEHLTPVIASEDLCNILLGWLDKYSRRYESSNELESNHEDWELRHIDVYGGMVISILDQPQCIGLSDDNSASIGYKIMTGVNNRMMLAIRLMKLLQTRRGNNLPTDFGFASRLYNALGHFIGRLHLKNQDAYSFLEIISSPLLNWLTRIDSQDESAYHQFKLVWKETLDSLRRSRPSLLFDSALLELQSTLLEKTLDHPNPSISEPTVSFWNSTYGDQIELHYPQNLLRVLDKLSRERRIKLCKTTTPSLLRKCSSENENGALLKRKEPPKDVPCVNMNMKRKRLELTEHQKEVRRAQRGRERDCGGQGLGGIKTYTSLDFSQGNKDSQDSQDVMNLESILEKFKRR